MPRPIVHWFKCLGINIEIQYLLQHFDRDNVTIPHNPSIKRSGVLKSKQVVSERSDSNQLSGHGAYAIRPWFRDLNCFVYFSVTKKLVNDMFSVFLGFVGSRSMCFYLNEHDILNGPIMVKLISMPDEIRIVHDMPIFGFKFFIPPKPPAKRRFRGCFFSTMLTMNGLEIIPCHLEILSVAVAAVAGSISNPIHWRLSFLAAAMVVPDPRNGSHTRSPSSVNWSIQYSASDCDCCHS